MITRIQPEIKPTDININLEYKKIEEKRNTNEERSDVDNR